MVERCGGGVGEGRSACEMWSWRHMVVLFARTMRKRMYDYSFQS